MSFSLNDVGATASNAVEVEIEARKRKGGRKLLRHEALQLALRVAGDAFSVNKESMQALLLYVPQILDEKAKEGETVRRAIHRIVLQEALTGWKDTIDSNIAKQHAPYNAHEVVDFVPTALKYLNLLCKRNSYFPEVYIDQNWIGLALLYLEDQNSERLLELEMDSIEAVLRSLAREIDGIAWALKGAAGRTNQKAHEYHDKLLELMDMLYMISLGQIDRQDVIWTR